VGPNNVSGSSEFKMRYHGCRRISDYFYSAPIVNIEGRKKIAMWTSMAIFVTKPVII
jgi:hypothetical protein